MSLLEYMNQQLSIAYEIYISTDDRLDFKIAFLDISKYLKIL